MAGLVRGSCTGQAHSRCRRQPCSSSVRWRWALYVTQTSALPGGRGPGWSRRLGCGPLVGRQGRGALVRRMVRRPRPDARVAVLFWLDLRVPQSGRPTAARQRCAASRTRLVDAGLACGDPGSELPVPVDTGPAPNRGYAEAVLAERLARNEISRTSSASGSRHSAGTAEEPCDRCRFRRTPFV